jgi:hydroxyethylthiazole kinase-like uncharacterized protein yjeF
MPEKQMQILSQAYIKSLLKPRQADSHKGTYGHSLLIAGSPGRMGAALIAARACLRTGTGLLTVNVPQEERFILQTAIPEAMLMMREKTEIDLNSFSAAGIGPGIGKDAIAIFTRLFTGFKKPLVLDADALNILAENPKFFEEMPENTLLTPHPKEFDRLFGVHQKTEERIQTAVQKAKAYKIVVILKGHQTCLTDGNEIFMNTTGNAGLAKGGSGDALTGMLTALLAQGYEPLAAAKIGVFLHGLAADLTLTVQSPESMLITDVIENLGKAFREVMSYEL